MIAKFVEFKVFFVTNDQGAPSDLQGYLFGSSWETFEWEPSGFRRNRLCDKEGSTSLAIEL